VDFHQAVIQGCENQIISRSLPMFVASCSEWYNVWTSLDFGKVLDSFETYHPKILAAVEAHDPDMAYQYSREHTQEIIDIYRSQKKTEI
jgi:DNA-binding FadR family transcriptional regulator